MKNKFKTFGTVKTVVGSFNLFAIIFLLAGIYLAPNAYGQEHSPDPCTEPDFTFEGEAGLTLCDQHGEILCDIEVGVGTPITHSSQIGSTFTGNVCVKGDFRIDKSFKFLNCTVKIDPGVTIFVQTPQQPFFSHLLTIDNSKLFACDDLWNGIVMSNSTTVSTKNGTEIEDAEIAIRAQNTQYSNLLISNTTFNRNRVGISLEASSAIAKGPHFFIFEDNLFRCTAPLNGTVDEITEIGVNIENVFNAFLDNPYSTNNTFSNIINGIVATGDETDVTIYGYDFKSVRNRGIDFSGRSLKVYDSIFDSVIKHGIYWHSAQDLFLRNNEFYLRELTEDIIFRYMVQVYNPEPANSINIQNNFFYSEGQIFSWNSFAIQLDASSITAFDASIFGNTFELFNASLEIPGDACHAIALWANMSDGSDVDIEYNDINVNTFILNNNRGINSWYGVKNNVHIIGNDFTGGGTHLDLRGSDGEGNEVTSNEHFQSSDFGTGLFARDFQNLSVCSNTNHAASNVSYLFNGANNGMTFSGNVTFGGAQHSLWVAGTDPVIGQQFQAGNEWYPGLRPIGGGQFIVDHPFLQHASTNLNLIEMSKFFVHTQQSIFQNGQYSFFSEFHPAFIDPDVFPLEDAFFQFLSGTPNISCIVQLTSPDGGDKALADGNYGNYIASPAAAWDGQRHLYQKLQSNPGYESTYGGFTSFLQAHTSSNIGRFYLLEQKIHEAAQVQAALKAQVETARTAIEGVDADIAALVGGSSYTEDSLYTLLEERYGLVQDIAAALVQFDADKSTKLSEAETVHQTISPSASHETYRSTVFGIYLQAQLYQGGQYDTLQIEQLKAIARLCSEEGGMTVYIAQGLLSDCDLASIQEDIDACNPELEAEPRSSNDNNSFEVLGGTPEKGFYFYPNPSHGRIVLSNQKGMEGRAEIFTSAGQLLKARNVAEGEGFWDVELPSGIYLFKVSFNNGEVVSDKLIINK